MAVDHGLRYTVQVTSRFDLFNAGNEEQENDLQTLSSQIRDEDNPNNQISRKKLNESGETRNSSRNKLAVSGQLPFDHQKEEHTRNKHYRTHAAPLHGRQFDRRSGSDKTGVKAVPKKDGYGTGNWGTVQDELEATMVENNYNLEESEEKFEPVPNEPEPTTLTLEEYKAMQQGRTIAPEDATTRRANDGQDVFKNMKLVRSKPTEEMGEVKFASVYRTTNDSGIAIQVLAKEPTPRGSRGGDRRGRGGRGSLHSDRDNRPARKEEERTQRRDENARSGKLTRGASKSSGETRGRGGPRLATRGRGGPVGGQRYQSDTPRFNDKDFPALG